MRRGTAKLQFKSELPASTPPFSPLEISGCGLWLDGSDSSSITLDGSNNVEQWRDKSGNVRHANQATALARPSIESVNSLNAVTFDAVDDFMTGTTPITSNSAFTLFGVVRKNAAGTDRVSYFILGSDKSFGLSVSSNAVFFDLPGYLNGGVAWREGAAVVMANGSTIIQQLSRTPNTSTHVRYPGAHSTSFSDTPVAAPYGDYRIGFASGAARQSNTICEIIYYDSDLSAGNKTAVREYLGTKWNVAV